MHAHMQLLDYKSLKHTCVSESQSNKIFKTIDSTQFNVNTITKLVQGSTKIVNLG